MGGSKQFGTGSVVGATVGVLTFLLFSILLGLEGPTDYTPVCLELMEHADTVQVMKDHRICRNAIF